MPSIVSELEVLIGANIEDLKRGLKTADRKVQSFGARVGDEVADIGKKFAVIGTGAALGIGVFAVRAAVKFESSFADVKKTVDATDEELDHLRSTIRDMATNTENPLSALENAHETLANIMAMGGALGIATDDLDDFTETVGMMTVATDLSAESAADFFARFSNITGVKPAEWRDMGDAIVELGNTMAATESEIAAFALRLAPLSTFNFSPQDILGYSTALASLGVSAELGGTNMLKSVNDMVRAVSTGKGLKEFADVAGMTADNFKQLAQTDPSAAFDAFIEGLGKLPGDEQLGVLEKLNITGVEQQGVLIRMANGYDTVEKAVGTANTSWRDSNALMDEATSKADTSAGKIKTLKNNVNDLGIKLGDLFLDDFNELVEGVTKIVQGDPGTGLMLIAEGLGDIGATLLGMVGIGSGDIDVAGGLQALVDDWQRFGDIIILVAQLVYREIDRFVLDLRIRILEFIGSLRDDILGVTGFDISPMIHADIADVKLEMFNLNIATALENELNAQLATGQAIDLTVPLDLDTTKMGEEMSLVEIMEIASPEDITALATKIGLGGSMAIEEAINQMIASGDAEGVKMMLPLAEALGIDIDSIALKVSDALNAALMITDETAFDALIPLATELDIDTADMQKQMQAQTDALSDFAYAATLGVDFTITASSVDWSQAQQRIYSSIGATSFSTKSNEGGGAANTLVPTFDGGGTFHSGAEGGPAWLHDDETVRTPAQERALGRRMGGGGGDTYIVNSYGQNPYGLVREIDRARRNSA